MRKLIACLLALTLLTALLPTTVYAAGVIGISTAKELRAIASNPNADYALLNDISLSAYASWTPIEGFGGTLDGNGHAISGLRIATSGSSWYGYGLFANYDGRISNLTVSDAQISVVNPSVPVNVSILGVPNNWYDAEPGTNAPQAVNCNVSGTIALTSGLNEWHNVFALVGAQNSTANVSMDVSATNSCSAMQRGCVGCTSDGRITLRGRMSGSDGLVCGVWRGRGCTNNAALRVERGDSPESSFNVRLYGVHSDSANPCSGCVNNGSLYAEQTVSALQNCRSCINNGTITSDDIRGVELSVNCRNDASMFNLGRSATPKAAFLLDSAYGGNVSGGTYTYRDGDVSPTSIQVSSMLGRASKDGTNVDILTLASCALDLSASYAQGADGATHTGNIDTISADGSVLMRLNTANTGNITCVSDNARMDLRCGSHNSGDVTVQAGGDAVVVGGTYYNSGAINGSSDTGSCTVIGVQGAPGKALNVGQVRSSTMGSGTAYAFGSKDSTYNTNTASVSASANHNGAAVAFGTSGDYSVNLGSVDARAAQNSCDAGGAVGSYTVNYGDVTASGLGDNVSAFGFSDYDTGSRSFGTVSASNYSIENNANAHADSGTAIATGGARAFATGATASATSLTFHASATTGHECYYITYHPPGCGCERSTVTVPAGTSIKDDLHGYMKVAGAYGVTAVAPPAYTAPDIGMPEQAEPEQDGDLTLSLHAAEACKSADEITSFTRACGSLRFAKPGAQANDTDYDVCYLRADMECYGEQATDMYYTLILPDGLSFAPHSVVDREYVLFSPSAPGEKKSVSYPVYPLHVANDVASLRVEALGDLNASLELPVRASADEGKAYFPGTGGVTKFSGLVQTPFALDPLADFTAPTGTYSQKLARFGVTMSVAAYNKDGMISSLLNAGFNNIKWCDSSGSDGVAHCFATKKLVADGKVNTVVLVVVRGTVGTEWIGNFYVNGLDRNQTHAGFTLAATEVLTDLSEYATAHELSQTDTRAFVCGHSRGGAVANLVAHNLLSWSVGGVVDEVTAYTYATPSVVKQPTADAGVFNLIFAQDVVGYVPAGYGKYGTSYVMGDVLNNAAGVPDVVKQAYLAYTGGTPYQLPNSPLLIFLALDSQANNAALTYLRKPLGTLLNGPTSNNDITVGHCPENYLSWVNYGSIGIRYEEACRQFEEGAFLRGVNTLLMPPQLLLCLAVKCLVNATVNRLEGVVLAAVHCPVDVKVLDGDGNVVATVKGHELQSYDETKSLAASVDGSDYVVLPQGQTYTLAIDGTADGTMQLELHNVSEQLELRDSVAYRDVAVLEGGSATLTLSADADKLQATLISNGVWVAPSGMSDVLVLPAGLTEIGARAFAGCTSATTVVIPKGVTSIAEDAFEGVSPKLLLWAGTYAEDYATRHGLTFELLP